MAPPIGFPAKRRIAATATALILNDFSLGHKLSARM
jgi:hypothetical protein